MVVADGLPFWLSLVVCTATVVDADTGRLTDDGVEAAGAADELATVGAFLGEELAETPVPTGTFCRY